MCMAEASYALSQNQPPGSPLSFLFALLCPRMSFDLCLPFFRLLAFPAFLQPFLLLPSVFFRTHRAVRAADPPSCLLCALSTRVGITGRRLCVECRDRQFGAGRVGQFPPSHRCLQPPVHAAP